MPVTYQTVDVTCIFGVLNRNLSMLAVNYLKTCKEAPGHLVQNTPSDSERKVFLII